MSSYCVIWDTTYTDSIRVYAQRTGRRGVQSLQGASRWVLHRIYPSVGTALMSSMPSKLSSMSGVKMDSGSYCQIILKSAGNSWKAVLTCSSREDACCCQLPIGCVPSTPATAITTPGSRNLSCEKPESL